MKDYSALPSVSDDPHYTRVWDVFSSPKCLASFAHVRNITNMRKTYDSLDVYQNVERFRDKLRRWISKKEKFKLENPQHLNFVRRVILWKRVLTTEEIDDFLLNYQSLTKQSFESSWTVIEKKEGDSEAVYLIIVLWWILSINARLYTMSDIMWQRIVEILENKSDELEKHVPKISDLLLLRDSWFHPISDSGAAISPESSVFPRTQYIYWYEWNDNSRSTKYFNKDGDWVSKQKYVEWTTKLIGNMEQEIQSISSSTRSATVWSLIKAYWLSNDINLENLVQRLKGLKIQLESELNAHDSKVLTLQSVKN
jgi:hypothetical protein